MVAGRVLLPLPSSAHHQGDISAELRALETRALAAPISGDASASGVIYAVYVYGVNSVLRVKLNAIAAGGALIVHDATHPASCGRIGTVHTYSIYITNATHGDSGINQAVIQRNPDPYVFYE